MVVGFIIILLHFSQGLPSFPIIFSQIMILPSLVFFCLLLFELSPLEFSLCLDPILYCLADEGVGCGSFDICDV